jgi:hypothetical protein
LVAAALGASGCGSEPVALLLHQICTTPLAFEAQPACYLGGDARRTTGMTGNTVAFHLGPATGSLHIRLAAVPGIDRPRWSLDLLAASARPEGTTVYVELTWGTCTTVCPASDPQDASAPASESFQWLALVQGVEGAQISPSSTERVPPDAVLTFRGADVDIVDIRLPGYEPLGAREL